MSSSRKLPVRTTYSSGKTSFSFAQISQRPLHPRYTDLAVRLQSFQGQWPAEKTQKPRDMSEAGFFYAGESCVVVYAEYKFSLSVRSEKTDFRIMIIH
jgi:hypothetical protein